jgi:hypothetical protein
MLISNSKKFIYIHLHKCAGTSVERALGKTIAWNDILLGSTPEGERLQAIYQTLFGLEKHSSAAEVCAVVGREIWDACYTFATVRNPYALAVSLYTHSLKVLRRHTREASASASAAGANQTISVNPHVWPWNYPGVRALLAVRGEHTTFSEFIRSPHLPGWAGFATMRSQLCDANGSLLMREVFKVEELEAVWPLIVQKTGVPDVPLGRDNRSVVPGVSFGKFYRPGDADFIRTHYREDFQLFGYSENVV